MSKKGHPAVVEGQRVSALLLPGAVLPAALAYADLIPALGDDVDARAKELEVYAKEEPPADFGLETEVEGLRRFADEAGFERFHLVGYSGGGAVSIAFCAAHPDRLLSLVLNEPAWAGFSDLGAEERRFWDTAEQVIALPPDEMMPPFIRMQLRPGVEAPAPPPGPPPDWMRQRPAGLKAFMAAFKAFDLDYDRLHGFDRPVLFTLGGKSNPDYYAAMVKRLRGIFPNMSLEVFEDRHHFDPPHRVEPERMATLLKHLWAGSD